MKLDTVNAVSNIVKLIFIAFEDDRFLIPDKELGIFAVGINPESVSEAYENKHDTRNSKGNQHAKPIYSFSPPRRLSFDFTLDGTNTAEGYFWKGVPVSLQVLQLVRTVYDMKGNSHIPRFLWLFWGPYNFKCVLSSMTINYTLFKPDGTPLRAKVSAAFISYEKDSEVKKQSPDITKHRKIKAGDRLDHLIYKEYNDPKYLMQVARANGLTSVRNIKPNADITFPPIDKKEI